MAFARRIFFFLLTNILISMTVMIVFSILGALGFHIAPNSGQLGALAVFCLVWGMGFAFVSLLISKRMAIWMTGVQIIDPNTTNPRARALVNMVHRLAERAGLPVMPDVGIYESPEVNAFATGPSKRNSLVAVSSGILERMSPEQLEGVLGHEITHVANGDMVTMTLLTGVINAFVMFLTSILSNVIAERLDSRNRGAIRFAVSIALQLVLTILGSMVLMYYSRQREYRADAGGAKLAGRGQMISALQALQATLPTVEQARPAIAALRISNVGGFFASHPPLEVRIARLQGLRTQGE